MKKSLFKILIVFAAIFGAFAIFLSVSNNSVYAADHTPHDGIEDHGFNKAKWDKDDSLPNFEGEYYLTKDVTLTERWRPGKQVKLCLNGHCIKLAGQGSVIEFRSSDFCEEISLSIYDCSEVEHKYRINEEGLAIVDDTLTENYSTFKGGYITNSGNLCGNGGCIDLTHGTESKTNLYMSGVNILGNKVVENGAGIYYKYEQGKKCTISLNNVSIFGNVAGGKGAGIYQEASGSDKAALTLNNVNVSNNKSGVAPAGIYEESPLAVKGNVYVYDNKVYNEEEKDGLEADIIVTHDNQSKFSVVGKLVEGSKIGYALVKPAKIFDYYKVFDENDATKNNDADPNTIFISNSCQRVTRASDTSNDLDVSCGIADEYVVNYDEKPHGIYLYEGFENTSSYLKYLNEETGEYTLDTSPEFTDIGTYSIHYNLITKFFTTTGTQNVIIDKRLPLPSVAKTDLYYNGASQELVTIPENPGATFNFKIKDGYWSEYIPKAVEIGEYTIYVRALGDDDHANTEYELKATILANDKTALAEEINTTNTYYNSILEKYSSIAEIVEEVIEDANALNEKVNAKASEITDMISRLQDSVTQAGGYTKQVDDVVAAIDAIGDVTLEKKEQIEAARALFVNIPEEFQALVTNYLTLVMDEFRYTALVTLEERVNEVIDSINAIGDVSYDDATKARISDARSKYNLLPDAIKGNVTNLATLEEKETAYANLVSDHASADEVIEKINRIGTVLYDDETKTKLDEARGAYDALSDAQKQLVTNYQTLTDAEELYASFVLDDETAGNVDDLIDAIGTVEYNDEVKARIDAARAAYDALTDEQKELVLNYNLLTVREGQYTKLAEDHAAANNVDELISAIGDVAYTKECNEKIQKAKAAYKTLTEARRVLVKNLVTLTNAEKTYSDIDKAAVAIDSIEFVEYNEETKQKINDASALYDSLSEENKAKIPNYDKLKAAEEKYNNLGEQHKNTIFIIIYIAAGALVVVGLFVGYMLMFFVFNKIVIINSKRKRVFMLGKKNDKIKLLKMNFRIIYRDEIDVYEKNA